MLTISNETALMTAVAILDYVYMGRVAYVLMSFFWRLLTATYGWLICRTLLLYAWCIRGITGVAGDQQHYSGMELASGP